MDSISGACSAVIKYSVTLLALVFLTYPAASLSLSFANWIDPRPASPLGVWLPNVAPPLLLGFTGFYLLARHLSRADRGLGVGIPFLVRTTPLLGASLGLGAFILSERSRADFGLYGQLFIWPLFAALGGIFGDLVATHGKRVV